MISAVLVVFGLFVLGMGLLGMVRPDLLMDAVRRAWGEDAALWAVAGLRAGLGVLLLAGAGQTRHPDAVRIIGAVALAGGLAIPLLGRARVRRFVAWWSARPAGFQRAWAAAAAAFGAFLLYTAS